MHFKNSLKISWFLAILIFSSLTLTKGAWSQSVSVDLAPIAIEDLQKIDRCFQEAEVKDKIISEQDKTISELEKSLALEKRTNELNERELYLQKKINEIKDMEITAYKDTVTRQNDLIDRSLKLAEISKPKSNWEFTGLLGLAAFAIGLLIR